MNAISKGDAGANPISPQLPPHDQGRNTSEVAPGERAPSERATAAGGERVLTEDHIDILRALAESRKGPMMQCELMAAIERSKRVVSLTSNQLETWGLVEHPARTSRKGIRITQQGRQVYEERNRILGERSDENS